MKFHEKLRAFRDEQLNISQKEAALLLEVSNVNLSRYETAERQPSLEFLHRIRTKYKMTDEQFLDLLTEDTTVRKPMETFLEQAHETQSRYYSQFSELLTELLSEKSFRLLLLYLRDLPEKERKEILEQLVEFLSTKNVLHINVII